MMILIRCYYLVLFTHTCKFKVALSRRRVTDIIAVGAGVFLRHSTFQTLDDFFFRGTFHNMFQTRHTCTYSCIGTSGNFE